MASIRTIYFLNNLLHKLETSFYWRPGFY